MRWLIPVCLVQDRADKKRHPRLIVEDLEEVTLERACWFNNQLFLSALNYRNPRRVEADYDSWSEAVLGSTIH
jgi:hypothetical protein